MFKRLKPDRKSNDLAPAGSQDLDTGTIQARAVFPNPEGDILPGQFVRIVLKGLMRTDATVLPEPAVMQGPQGTFVYRLTEDQKAEVAPVKMGPNIGSEWLVEEGLKPGDRVEVEGVIRVRPGQSVRLSDASLRNMVEPGSNDERRPVGARSP